jgi:bleomycin hydrolase
MVRRYNLVYGDDGAPAMDKETRLRYGETVMTHAMVFTAYDGPCDHPTKWRVENSYAQLNGDNGYMVMTDSWFDEYNFQVAVDIELLTPQLIEILGQEPVVLPAWDPMGALAGNVEQLFSTEEIRGAASSKL